MSLNFASDNVGPIAPEILSALEKANSGSSMPYGADPWMADVRTHLRSLLKTPEAEVVLVSTGTAANALAVACLVQPWQSVLCHKVAHIEEDECGAPEFFSGGAKLVLLDGEHGRIAPQTLKRALQGLAGKSVHNVQKGALSITNVTEAGTVYDLKQQAALIAEAKASGLPVHLDGARFANACVALDCSAAELAQGVDLISFGGTKNGCMGVEALVMRDPTRLWELELRRKRAGHLWSKHRYLSAQMLAYLENDLWLKLAEKANTAAQYLVTQLKELEEIDFVHPPQANMIFARLPRAKHKAAFEGGAQYYLMEGPKEGPADTPLLCRLVCDWSKTNDDIDTLINLYKTA